MIISDIDKNKGQPSTLTNILPISSYSYYHDHTVMITTNNDIFGYGSNNGFCIIGSLPKTKLTKLTQFYIKNEKGQILYPISAYCSLNATLYMVSETKDSKKRLLAYSGYRVHTQHPYFYDMNNLNPVALFGSSSCFSAIDSEGSVILVPEIDYRVLYRNSIYKLEATFLPDGEKACNITYGFDSIIILTLSGRVLVAKYKTGTNDVLEAIDFVKYISFKDIKIKNISCLSHVCFALSEEGRIFSVNSFASEYSEITLFKKDKIKEVYAGSERHLFQTDEGKVILYEGNHFDNKTPQIETVINKNAKFCIIGSKQFIIFTDIDPLMSPNRKISADKLNVTKKGDEKNLSDFIKNQINMCTLYEEEEEKMFFINMGKIDENNKSISYKIFDKRTRTPMCKKILKSTIKDSIDIKNKFQFLYENKYKCITNAIGINNKNALFFEFNEYKLEDVLKMKINNTFKAKIALDIAHTINHLQKRKMKNIGLKIDNIKLNSFFEIKLEIFELILNEENDLVDENDSKIFISPKFLNDNDDDDDDDKNNENIDDTYSFGLILYYIFTQKFPFQKSKNKKRDNEIKLPTPSDSISAFCIDLIKQCICIDKSKRPSIEKILSLMKMNLYEFAPDVDSIILEKRDKELNKIENPYSHQ